MSSKRTRVGVAVAVAAAIWAPSAALADDPPECDGDTATIVGTEGPDDIVGTPERDIIVALGGDDTITGDLEDDLVCTGEGNDTLVSPGGLRAFGGPGDDRLAAQETDVTDITKLYGEAGNDELISAGGNTDLFGGDGDDALVGGADRDYLYPGLGRDTVDGGGGVDTLSSELRDLGPVEVNLTKGVGKGQGRDTITRVENADGTVYDDTLIGDAGPNVFSAHGSGLDVIYGKGGDDQLHTEGATVFGGPGDDHIELYRNGLAPTDDEFDGGPGFDWLHYNDYWQPVTLDLVAETSSGPEQGTDIARGFEAAVGSYGADTMIGTAAVNTFYGRSGADRLVGNGGNDNLFGLGNDDVLEGGEGDDYLDGGRKTDTLNGGPGQDVCTTGETVTECES